MARAGLARVDTRTRRRVQVSPMLRIARSTRRLCDSLPLRTQCGMQAGTAVGTAALGVQRPQSLLQSLFSNRSCAGFALRMCVVNLAAHRQISAQRQDLEKAFSA